MGILMTVSMLAMCSMGFDVGAAQPASREAAREVAQQKAVAQQAYVVLLAARGELAKAGRELRAAEQCLDGARRALRETRRQRDYWWRATIRAIDPRYSYEQFGGRLKAHSRRVDREERIAQDEARLSTRVRELQTKVAQRKRAVQAADRKFRTRARAYIVAYELAFGKQYQKFVQQKDALRREYERQEELPRLGEWKTLYRINWKWQARDKWNPLGEAEDGHVVLTCRRDGGVNQAGLLWLHSEQLGGDFSVRATMLHEPFRDHQAIVSVRPEDLSRGPTVALPDGEWFVLEFKRVGAVVTARIDGEEARVSGAPHVAGRLSIQILKGDRLHIKKLSIAALRSQ